MKNQNERQKVAIIFGSQPGFDENAFRYFLLRLNEVQSLYEFGFPAVDDYLFSQKEVDTDRMFRVFSEAKKKEAEHREAEKEEKEYIILEGNPKYFILIVGQRIRDNLFYDWRHDDTAIVTTHRWDKDYSPPSVFEYLLNSICSVLVLLNLKDELHTHNTTRGCLLDYAEFKEEIKADVVLGYICDDCRETITEHLGPHFLEGISKMVHREWIGSLDTYDSTAYNLKRYFHFDIYQDSGFNKTFWERAVGYFPEIPGKIIMAVIGALITFLLGYLAAKCR
jgi:hypothetical protein